MWCAARFLFRPLTIYAVFSSKLLEIIKHHFPTVHCYADDTQVYISFSPNDMLGQLTAGKLLESCIADIRAWMFNENLTLNDEKTEFLIIGTPQQLEKVAITHIRVGNTNIYPVPVARNLRSWFDYKLSMTNHITKICASSFFYLYNIRRIWKYLTKKSAESLIHAFISSRLDYCNSLLYGLPNCSLIKLQRVQNACARLTFNEGRYCRITPLLVKLHWLPVQSRIVFKILLLTFKILHGTAPSYLESLISLKPQSRYNLRCSRDTLLLKQPTFIAKVTLNDRSFTCAAPKLWNALPFEVRHAKSLDIFKTKSKSHPFYLAFLS